MNSWLDVGYQSGWKWVDKYCNIGSAPHRLYTDEFIIKTGCAHHGVEERMFAMYWDFENNGGSCSRPLECLYSDERIQKLVKDDEDQILLEMVAQTTIQWLGTNCGSAFINEVRRLAKKDSERLLARIDPKALERAIEDERKSQPVNQWHVDSLREQHVRELKELKEKHERELREFEESIQRQVNEGMERRKQEEIKQNEFLFKSLTENVHSRALDL